MPGLRLGKKPATDDAKDLLFSSYVDATQLPPTPAEFGHEKLFPPKGWGMLGNDEWGDCAWAGPAHETMLLSTEGGHAAAFTTAGVLSDYSAGTGFDPNAGPPGKNPTDNGSEVRKVLSYRRKTGIIAIRNGLFFACTSFIVLLNRDARSMRNLSSVNRRSGSPMARTIPACKSA